MPLVVAATRRSTAWEWSVEPLVVIPLVIAAVAYVRAARATTRRRPSVAWTGRIVGFLAGLAAVAVALASPIDALADERFSVHMVQHILLTLFAPPLLLLGRPLTLAIASSRQRGRATLAGLAGTRAARFLGSPAFGFTSFALVLWISHLSPLYEATLNDGTLHAAEHLAYLATATAFWWPLVARDPGAARLSHPARVLYLFLSMPMMSLLGFVISSSGRVLYSHYVAAARSVGAALADQRLGGTIMWESSMLGGAVALSLVLLDWMRYDDLEARRSDLRRSVRGRDAVEARGG
jgi:cytochrome c oxidase assembly factor CtaG